MFIDGSIVRITASCNGVTVKTYFSKVHEQSGTVRAKKKKKRRTKVKIQFFMVVHTVVVSGNTCRQLFRVDYLILFRKRNIFTRKNRFYKMSLLTSLVWWRRKVLKKKTRCIYLII